METEEASGGSGVAGTVLISTLPRAEGRSDLELPEAAIGVLALAVVGSMDSSVGSAAAGSWVVSCVAGGDVVDASVLDAGTRVLSKTVLLVPWKELVGAAVWDGAVSGRPTCFWRTLGSSGAAAEAAPWGRGEVVAFSSSSSFTIFLTHGAAGSAQISLDFTVVNLKIKRG